MRPTWMNAVPSLLPLTALLCSFTAARGQDVKVSDADRPASRADVADPILAELLAVHNKIRAEEKLGPLKLDARLTTAARAHARDMAQHQHLAHDGSDESTPKDRIKRAGYVYKEIGENVAVGQDTVSEVMRVWLESPPHREGILGDFTEMGGAVARGSDGREYWCVDFGRPMPPVDPARSPGELIAALNRARAQAKKRPLKRDPVLARVAARFAREAAARRSLDARDSDGKTPFAVLESEGYRSRRFAVTLASGEGDPAKVAAAWLEDKRDREHLLSAFDRVGVGVATDPAGVPYWVVLIAQGVGR